MKIKRKQNSLNGVKSSNASDLKSDSKFEIIKTDLNLNLENKSSDKKDKMGMSHVTSNGSFTNGLLNDSKNKSAFKEKKKSINNTGLTNQLSSANSLNKNECLKDDENKSQLPNQLGNYHQISSSLNNLSSNDNSNSSSSVNSNLINNCSTELSNKLQNNDLSNFKSSKRELDSSESSNLKKKIKNENLKSIETKEVCIETSNVSTMTEPDCLGFAEPGTSIILEGAVLDEIEGVLVVNVTWRGKTFVGTLLDCTKHDWAPPRFNCDSPTSDLESRGGRNRNCKRSRGSISENENSIKLQQSKLRNGKGRRNNFTVPASPVRISSTNNKSDNAIKQNRSTPPLDSINSLTANINNENNSNNNSSNSNNNSNNPVPILNSQSNQPTNQNSPTKNQQNSPVLIECPEPNCNKKYKHINGLKYHQTHAHHDSNNSKLSNNHSSANKNDEISELNKDNEETTDTEDYIEESIPSTNNKTKTASNKTNKSNGKKEDRTNSNRSPSAYSDISDDTENESRPSSNNSVQTSQSINNLSAKNDEITKSATSLSLFSPPSENEDHNNSKLLSLNNKDEDQKTNEELRKLASEVDQKISDVAQQHSNTFPNISGGLSIDKLSLLTNNTTTSSSISVPSKTTNSMLLNNTSALLAKTNNSLLPPNFSMDPSLHAYLIQNDPNYRLNYERYLIENQEKFFSSLASTDLNFNNKDLIFKLPSNNPHLPNVSTSSTSNLGNKNINERPASTGGGSIVNGTSSQSQNNNSAGKNPYDFMEFEKQFEKHREEMFRLSRTPMPNNTTKPSTKDIQPQQNAASVNKPIKIHDESVKPATTGPPPSNFPFNFPNPSFLNPSSTIAQTSALTSFQTSLNPHLPFDPQNFFRNGQSPLLHPQTGNLLNSAYRFAASAGLSPIDLNNTNNASKLLTSAQQQQQTSVSTQLLNNNNKQELNGLSADKLTPNRLHRTLTAGLSQNSSSILNTSNNSNLSASSKKDENRSPPLRLTNNAQHVGVGGFPAPFIDPYGELIQQAASSVCLIPYASK